jgi:hypothetical protein
MLIDALFIIPVEYTTCVPVQTHNMIILNLNQALIKPWFKQLILIKLSSH